MKSYLLLGLIMYIHIDLQMNIWVHNLNIIETLHYMRHWEQGGCSRVYERERERVRKKINYYRITLNLTYIYARLKEDSRLNAQLTTTDYNYKGKD